MEILLVSSSNSTAVGPHGTKGTDVGVAALFQLSRIHYHMLMLKALKVKHSASRLLLLNKNVFSQKAQANDIILFRNFDSYKFPQCHQISPKLNKIGEIINLMKKRILGAFKTNPKHSKSIDEGSRSRSQSMKEQSRYKQEKTKTRPKKAKLKSQIKITFNKNVNIGEIKVDLNIMGDC
ncbi:hypothetical protein Tco_0809009 [Tanacetum coccineum]